MYVVLCIFFFCISSDNPASLIANMTEEVMPKLIQAVTDSIVSQVAVDSDIVEQLLKMLYRFAKISMGISVTGLLFVIAWTVIRFVIFMRKHREFKRRDEVELHRHQQRRADRNLLLQAMRENRDNREVHQV